MNFRFEAPDKVMVGAIGEVGERLFLFQVREGRRLVIVKCEKQQLAALATWIAAVIESLGRPEHLPGDLALEPEYEPDFAAGEITVALDAEHGILNLQMSAPDEDHELTVALTREWGAALAIAITTLVEAGRPACPLCGYPLDPRGHDCPRTNGHTAPLR